MKKFLSIILFGFLFSCNRTDCSQISSSFKSYIEAERILSNTSFNYTDKVNTDKSSWIRAAKFYSCDKQTGFFLIKTDKEEYIHKDVPIEIWTDFKNAQSFGSYYNQNIKYYYQLILIK
ncbi:MAG: KTSC domain-containing protein [Chitinophagaceae bacterium]